MRRLVFLLVLGLISSSFARQTRRPGGGRGKGRIPFYAINKNACNGRKIGCLKNEKYRSITGVCNNLRNPYLGAANSILSRFIEPEYFDCLEVPKGGYEDGNMQDIQGPIKGRTFGWWNPPVYFCTGSRQKLPNVREVSNTFHPDMDIPQEYFSLMVMQFGQFLDHDMALTPEVEPDEECCEHPDTEDCYPIYIPNEDPFYSTREAPQTCLEFTRSDAFCPESIEISQKKGRGKGKGKGKGKGRGKGKGKGKGPWWAKKSNREQYSIVTSFVDGSQIYSPNEVDAANLRSTGGKLKTNPKYSRELLPVVNGSLMAGDIRALDMPGLATIHTIFVREHNRIARLVSSKYKDDEEIYQQSRKIVIAELQNIVYGEYLPVILGKEAVEKYGLGVEESTDYDDKEDPSIVNSFKTAAYRFGHSLIQGLVNMANLDDPASVFKTYQLRENFFNMENYLLDDGLGMERIAAGLIGQQAQTMNRFVTEDVTNFLFLEIGENTGDIGKRDFGADLVSRNLQRGRDHGLPGYNKYRRYCGLKGLPSFKSGRYVPHEIPESNWKVLAELYETPDDIDLFVGGLAEFPVSGGLTSPTFNCIKSIQFKRLMDGDRFFFTHKNQAGSFTSSQLSQLRKRTFRDIICENTELAKARENVFLLKGELVDCNDVNTLDINIFI